MPPPPPPVPTHMKYFINEDTVVNAELIFYYDYQQTWLDLNSKLMLGWDSPYNMRGFTMIRNIPTILCL